MCSDLPPALDARAFHSLLLEYMPQVAKTRLVVEEMGYGLCRVRLGIDAGQDMRAGGTISGPTMFMLADLALYGAVLSRIGHVPLAVTSTMTINFLRKPQPVDLLAEARILRQGRRSAYGDILIRSAWEDEPVAHATGSYAIPSGTTRP